MTKLNKTRVRWLVQQVVRHGRKPSAVASVYQITPRRVQQLVRAYRMTGEYQAPRKERRPRTTLTAAQHAAIEAAWTETRLSARLLWRELQRRGTPVPKNKLYTYLKATSRVVAEPRKARQRKRCRYEREHTGSLIHGDWHRTSQSHPHCILWLDDASRKILVGAERAQQSAQVSILTLDDARRVAAAQNVRIEQANTDRGSEFYSNKGGTSSFRAHLDTVGVQHVVSRVNNPQTNGKLERLWREYDRHRWRFGTLHDWIAWYNARLHGALRLDWAETPNEAFIRKMRPEELVGLVFR